MSAQVDVLAVLAKHHQRVAFGGSAKEADELAAARAAVAELAKTVDRIAYRLDQCGMTADGITKAQAAAGLRAALARFGGAA